MTKIIINESDSSLFNSLLNNIDNANTNELWLRHYIGMHTYIPSIVITIWALYKWLFNLS